MIDHFGINCADLEASARFYDAVLEVLGHRRLMDVGVAIGYGTDTAGLLDRRRRRRIRAQP